MRSLLLLAMTCLPHLAFAAGSDDMQPPAPTETTTKCAEGEVWDEKTKACTPPEDAGLDDDTRFGAVRELAHADRPQDALRVLASMREGKTDRVLTYLGFATRKTGRMNEGLAFYAAALDQNPDNLLARSYLGQAYVELGKTDLAAAQLSQIRARGGRDTWAATALWRALASGRTSNY